MSDPSSFVEILSKGGPVAILLAAGFALKWVIDSVSAYRAGKNAPDGNTADLATVNAGLVRTVESLQRDNKDLRAENDQLREDKAALYDEVISIKRDYEARLDALRKQLTDITAEVDALKRGLQSPPH